jgi:hypothetical protein
MPDPDFSGGGVIMNGGARAPSATTGPARGHAAPNSDAFQAAHEACKHSLEDIGIDTQE